ncbi:hypothetical protein C8R43DRAFT_1049264 [Mycena crocata]|nr:hypothetical protein C8R43DRAFT_1049264 [Mycena crocata]
MLFAFVLASVTLRAVSADSPCSAGHGAVEPGFEWCYEPNMGGKCVLSTTPANHCVNIGGETHPDNDQASSATTNANSVCQLYSAVNCDGNSIQIGAAATVNAFSELGFDKVMSSYRCEFEEPGFTWCEDENLGGKCLAVSGADGECVTFASTPDNDKASSAMTNPGSQCTLFQHARCGGTSILLPPLSAAHNFTDLGFNNMMSAYQCTSAEVPIMGSQGAYGLYEQF